jgi:hypothetical protein
VVLPLALLALVTAIWHRAFKRRERDSVEPAGTAKPKKAGGKPAAS